jgi:general secretion pathway protein I
VSRRGFTLLEVMVALALLAAALMAMADLAGGALRNHVYARDLSAATLLARGKMTELEQKYEDQGFKDFDEQEEGDFTEEGRPDLRWRLELVKPDANLSGDQLVALLAGAPGGDPQELISKLMGSAAGAALAGLAGGAPPGGASATPSGGPSGPTTVASANPLAGAVTGLLQQQLTALGETLKKSFREARLTVAWRDGKVAHDFTVTTHLLVLNPRAPNNARGDNPDVPPNLAAANAASNAANAVLQQQANQNSRAPSPAGTPASGTGGVTQPGKGP